MVSHAGRCRLNFTDFLGRMASEDRAQFLASPMASTITARILAAGIRFPESPSILGSSVKTEKGLARWWKTAVAYYAPAAEAFEFTGELACAMGPCRGCYPYCLGHTSGRLALSDGANARLWKTILRKHFRALHDRILVYEFESLQRSCWNAGFKGAVRLNGSSDFPVSETEAFAGRWRSLQFYDYTKRMDAPFGASIVGLTYSFDGSELSRDIAKKLLNRDQNVAVVYFGDRPKYVWGFETVDGDETDLRFLDPPGTVVVLKPKGNKLKKALRNAERPAFVLTSKDI